MRVKLIQNTKHGAKGQVVEVSKNEAFGLVDSGKAILTKDMVSDDITNKRDTNGKSTQLRTLSSK